MNERAVWGQRALEYLVIMRHERKLQINLSTSHAETGNLPGRTSLSMNGTAVWTEVKLPPAEESYGTCKHTLQSADNVKIFNRRT